MAEEVKVEEKDLPKFFKDKIKELDQMPDDNLFYGKDGMKGIYMDAYAVAKHCGNLVGLHFFTRKSPKKQEKLVPQLKASGHSGASFSLVINYARQYLEAESKTKTPDLEAKSKTKTPLQKIKELFSKGR